MANEFQLRRRYLGSDLSGLSTEELRECFEVLKKAQAELQAGIHWGSE